MIARLSKTCWCSYTAEAMMIPILTSVKTMIMYRIFIRALLNASGSVASSFFNDKLERGSLSVIAVNICCNYWDKKAGLNFNLTFLHDKGGNKKTRPDIRPRSQIFSRCPENMRKLHRSIFFYLFVQDIFIAFHVSFMLPHNITFFIEQDRVRNIVHV